MAPQKNAASEAPLARNLRQGQQVYKEGESQTALPRLEFRYRVSI